MDVLAEHYPPTMPDGSNGDPGPQILVLTQAVDQLRQERDEARRGWLHHALFPGDHHELARVQLFADDLSRSLRETAEPGDDTEKLQARIDELQRRGHG